MAVIKRRHLGGRRAFLPPQSCDTMSRVWGTESGCSGLSVPAACEPADPKRVPWPLWVCILIGAKRN